jgi:hypothetical protein
MQTIIETLQKVVDRSRIDRKLEAAAEEHEGVRNLLSILDRSETRLIQLRRQAGDNRRPPVPKAHGNVIRFDEYAKTPAIYKTVAERSVALVRDPASFMPVGRDTECILMPVEHVPSESLNRQPLDAFLDGLCRRFTGWRATRPVVRFERDEEGGFRPDFNPAASEGSVPDFPDGKNRLRSLPEGAVVIPVVSFRGAPPESLNDELREFVDRFTVPFVIVTGWPIVGWISEPIGCMVTFGCSAPVAAAAAAVLSGEAEAGGSLEGIV